MIDEQIEDEIPPDEIITVEDDAERLKDVFLETSKTGAEDGIIQQVDEAFKDWLKRRGWKKNIPVIIGDDPELDAYLSEWSAIKREKRHNDRVRQRCINYILNKKR